MQQTNFDIYPYFDPDQYHDACGTGFIAESTGQASRRVVTSALEAVSRLTHRGGSGSDDETGDGGGLLIDIPQAFFNNLVRESFGEELDDEQPLAVGMLFIDQQQLDWFEDVLTPLAQKLKFSYLGYREVPLNKAALGATARDSCPTIIQIFLVQNESLKRPAEAQLYLMRRMLEHAISAAHIDCFICSLSTKTIVYKGLLKAAQLDRFYPDLSEDTFTARVALFHERYSTNTLPNWNMAQPFRLLAHNGEINTIQGNRLWMRAREHEMGAALWGTQFEHLRPLVASTGSDSFSLDNALEFLMRSGRGMFRSMLMLMPEAYAGHPSMSRALQDFYIYHENLTEPWDGPAAIVLTDGDFVGAKMDRNGLRPLRYTVTKDGLVIMASEAGVIDIDPDNLLYHHHMTAGEIFSLALDGRGYMENHQLKAEVASRAPYQKLVQNHIKKIIRGTPEEEFESLERYQATDDIYHLHALAWSAEEVDKLLIPMATSGRESLGSMGDDTPPAVLSAQPGKFYDFFKHTFAQVTNPPIDPIREKFYTRLFTFLGSESDLTARKPSFESAVRIDSPVLSPKELTGLLDANTQFKYHSIDCTFSPDKTIKRGLSSIARECERAVLDGSNLILITDEDLPPGRLPIPQPLVVSTLHHHLINRGLRSKVSLICIAGDVVEDHHVACLVALGASAIYPYQAYQLISRHFSSENWTGNLANYRHALEKGLLKIMAKRGISTSAGYHGSMLLNPLGLSSSLLKKYFPSLQSSSGGLDINQIEAQLHARITLAAASSNMQLDERGSFRFRKDGLPHGFSPASFKQIRKIALKGSAESVNGSGQPIYIRDLLALKDAGEVPLQHIESAKDILTRFGAGAISLGAISDDTHRTLARGLTLVGSRSNTGEGGEHPDRFAQSNANHLENSYVKQVASGRFGVTTDYLAAAREIQIKVAQGAKPGEGGQLPGHKVSIGIAAVRNSTPGVPLISPPPHHDIYSIEDMAQLIFDLKQVNPRALVSVKLVSQAGVGTIAAGVVKGGADIVLISGGDGGTGATPLGSMKHAGLPWEFGLAETHQVLVANKLRDRVTLRVDGGLRTGEDVIKAAILGAEEFDFGTALLVALGCVMARQCHLNTCPTGIATQDPDLMRRFKGRPDDVINYLTAVAEEVRSILASIGAYSIYDIIGRTDLLSINPRFATFPGAKSMDLQPLLNQAADSGLPLSTRGKVRPTSNRTSPTIDEKVLANHRPEIMNHGQIVVHENVSNIDRAVGTRLSGELAFLYGKGNFSGNIQLRLSGVAGQSFGAFLTDGVELRLRGAANDYLGKGMSGGLVTVRFEKSIRERHETQTIIGNVALFGATGGKALIAGRAGERFAVRNSGAVAVVEGVGNHCCEYMTRGTVIVMGPIGLNFGAGMSGGTAYIYCPDAKQLAHLNNDFVRPTELSDSDESLVLRLIRQHHFHTGSFLAESLIANWAEQKSQLVKIVPLALDVLDYEDIYNQKVATRLGELLNE